MKRLLYFAALIVAIGSIGGHTFTAHAQTAQDLTPAQQAALEQQLEVAKAQLANLQMQAGTVPAGDDGSATVTPSTSVATPSAQPTATANNGLSAAQVAQFNNTLSNLVTMLTQLNASLASNATLTSEQQVAVQNTLSGMQNTLVAMATTINNASAQNSGNANNGGVSATAPVATNVTPQQQPLAQNTPSAPASTPATPATPATQSPTVAAQSTDNTQQTAQASSFWSFTKSHWPTIVIVLLVIAILAILFWPEKETVRTVTTTPPVTNKPKASAPGVTVSQTTVTTSPSNNGNGQTTTHTTTHTTPATPVASAVAAPTHK